MAVCDYRKQSPVNQLVTVRLKEMLSDVVSVIKIPTFQIIILQASLQACLCKQCPCRFSGIFDNLTIGLLSRQSACQLA